LNSYSVQGHTVLLHHSYLTEIIIFTLLEPAEKDCRLQKSKVFREAIRPIAKKKTITLLLLEEGTNLAPGREMLVVQEGIVPEK